MQTPVSRRRPPRYDLPKAAPGPLRLVQLFLNTTDHESGRELLSTPDALRAWFGDHGVTVERAGPAGLRRAHEFREALHAFLVTGRADPALRARLTVDLATGTLQPEGQDVEAALGSIIAIVYDAVRDGSWERLKACRNCGWAFWDESRNRSAAWCSMQLCGNRLKVRRHRAKLTPRSSR
jgi:predicted RNA-binding Zn ribbon-like protein